MVQINPTLLNFITINPLERWLVKLTLSTINFRYKCLFWFTHLFPLTVNPCSWAALLCGGWFFIFFLKKARL